MVRSQLVWFLWLDLGIPNNTSYVTRKNCLQKCGVRSSPQNVVGHDSRRDRRWWSKMLSFLKIFWGEIWRYLGQYLEFRHVWGLYTRLLDLTRAMRRKLVLFLTYKDLFVGIFVRRVPWNTSIRLYRARYSDTIHPVEMGFWGKILLVIFVNGLIRCLRRVSSPRLSKLIKNWSL